MKKIINIQGMTCGNCAGHVEEALKGVCGIKSVNVNLNDKNAVVELAHPVEDAEIKAAVSEAGYEVVGIQEA